jgi:hypothetical protein
MLQAAAFFLVAPTGTVVLSQQEPAMITRFPGLTPTRSRAVATDDLVFTVAVAPDSDKSKVLAATIYLADVAQKTAFNRAWDEWVDPDHPPMRACIGVAIEPPHLVEVVITAARA